MAVRVPISANKYIPEIKIINNKYNLLLFPLIKEYKINKPSIKVALRELPDSNQPLIPVPSI